jgi:hypothetical protein
MQRCKIIKNLKTLPNAPSQEWEIASESFLLQAPTNGNSLGKRKEHANLVAHILARISDTHTHKNREFRARRIHATQQLQLVRRFCAPNACRENVTVALRLNAALRGTANELAVATLAGIGNRAADGKQT